MSLREKLSTREYNDPNFLSGMLRHGREIEEELRERLKTNEREMGQAKERLAFLWHGVEKGSIVRKTLTDDVYRVTEIATADVAEDHKPWLYGVKRKVDGTFGVREVSIWGNWELVKEEEQTCNTQ